MKQLSPRATEVLLLVIGIALIVGIVVSRRGQKHAPATPTLRVAMSGLYPPFNYFDEQNHLVGFDVDVAREIAQRLNRTPNLITTAWDGILAGLVAHKFDVIIGSMAITEERKKTVNFSAPYYVSGAQLIVRNGSPIAQLKDLRGKTVGVTVGETYAAYLQAHDPGIKRLSPYKGGVPNLLIELKNKRIDAFVSDRLVGLHAIKTAGSDAVLAGEFLYREEMGIAVARGDDDLLAEINDALAAMKADGTYARISSKWFGRNILELE
ncbi:MAG: ABC transporter substrate-binding protein [Armatimonadota bacterium]